MILAGTQGVGRNSRRVVPELVSDEETVIGHFKGEILGRLIG